MTARTASSGRSCLWDDPSVQLPAYPLPATPEPAVRILRQLDLVMLVLALPVFVVADLPLAGYAAFAGAWIAQRVIQELLERRAARSDDPRTGIALRGGGMLVRPWIVALAILAVGIRDNEAGLAAGLLAVMVFTIHLGMFLLVRSLDGRSPRP